MKKHIFKPILAVLMIVLIAMSCKEKVSQEDIITEQQIIDLVLYVMDASQENEPLDSAVVNIVTPNETHTIVTDETGVAHFEDVAISEAVPFTIRKTGYTNVSSSVWGKPSNFRQHQLSQVVNLYPLSGDSVLATIQGRLTIETDVTNREREAVPEGTTVRAYNPSMWNDIAFFGETDANGNYEIKVPVSYDGDDNIDLVYPEIYENQTVALMQDDETIAVEDRMTFFSLQENAENNAIPALPSLYGTVDAPSQETAGSGLSLGAVVVPSALNIFNSNAEIIQGGSGYTDGDDQLIELSEGTNSVAAELQVDIVDGHIVNIDGFQPNGALYSSKPSINTNVLGGNGAVIAIQFVALYNIIIEENGSGYTTLPPVHITSYNYDPNFNVMESTNDYDLSAQATIVGGQIINGVPADGDTLSGYTSAMPPEIDITQIPTRQAMVSFNTGHISNGGQIVNMNIDDNGYGYVLDSPPAINIVSVAGYGSEGNIVANLDNEGQLTGFNIINPGSGYVQNVNDFRDDGTTSDDEAHPSLSTGGSYFNFTNINDVNPGDTFIRSASYGTGTPNDDQ